ncbi:efflux RND transporter permease subunit [Paenibacillus humicola]|uniref:efflux RND transporter permease subunit n=1 Tax=Paenibacillus humicola TaxID=3110540 RepID=UPI00237C1B55|nr:efflux RND transporter permease subunit [Paenibacillus humicola]
MNRLLEAATRRTVLIVTSLVILLAWGGLSAYRMQRDYLPAISNPTLMITVHAPGYDADRVKAEIAVPVTQAVRGINGLDDIETSSFADGLLVSLYFPMDYNMRRAEDDAALALNHIALPAGAERPQVTRVSTSSFPVFRLSLTAAAGKTDERTLRTAIAGAAAEQLKSLPGVSDVYVTGAGSDGYVLTVRTADLRRYGLTIDDVTSSLGDSDLTGAAGRISGDQAVIPLEATGIGTDGPQQERDLDRLQIRGANGRTVPLAAVADLNRTIVGLQTISRTDGQPSVVLDVLKTPSANITAVSDLVRERIRSIPGVQTGDVKLSVLLDEGSQVKASLLGLLREGLLGCALSIVSVLLFFRDARRSALIALSLPVCFLATAGLLKTMGFSLNLLTVSGLIVAMGRVIDDSIVVLDNMYRKVHESGGRASAGLLAEAVREMLPAIVSSTATTAAVYIPIALVGGMISAAFSGFAWSVVIALVTSLLVAMFIVPALYHVWRGGRSGRAAVSLEPVSHRVLNWAFPRRGMLLAVSGILLLGAAGGAFLLPVNFLPAAKSGQISVQLEFPEETPLTQIDASASRMEQALKADPDVATFSSVLGSTFTPQFDDVFDAGGGWIQGGNIANIAVSVRKGANVDAVTSRLQQRLTALAGGAICTVTNQNIAGDDSQLKIDLTGADAATLDLSAGMVRAELQKVPELSVEGAADDQEGIPKHRLTLDQQALSRYGISAADVYKRIRLYLAEGRTVYVPLAAAAGSAAAGPNAAAAQGAAGTAAGTSGAPSAGAGAGAAGSGIPGGGAGAPGAAATSAVQGAAGGAAQQPAPGSSMSIPMEIRLDTLSKVGSSSANADPATDTLSLLGAETFKAKDGSAVRLDQLATLMPLAGQSEIQERDGSPFASVTANITTRDIEKVARKAANAVAAVKLPAGVHYSINGISAQVDQMILGMGMAIACSILLVLLILSAAFRSWRAPLVVLLCIPLAYIGSVLGLLLFGGEWDLASLVGLLMLTGIVASNGIVLVDKIERNLAAGMEAREAIAHGTATRARPVLLTAAATVLTLLPLCIAGGSDAVVSQTLGIVVVFGMVSSTAISLIVIPVVYEWMYLPRERRLAKLLPARA